SAAEVPDTDIAVRVLIVRNWAVRQLRAAADLTRAAEIGQRTLADCGRVLGVEHPQTLGSRNDLAAVYESTGRLDEAIGLFERTLADRERVLGAEHPQTLGSRNDL